MQPIQVVNDHRITITGCQIGQHLCVLAARLNGERRHIVVDILGPDRPAPIRDELAAILQLACHPNPVPSASEEIRA